METRWSVLPQKRVVTVAVTVAIIALMWMAFRSDRTTTGLGHSPFGGQDDPAELAASSGMTEVASLQAAIDMAGHVAFTARDVPDQRLSSLWVNLSTGDVLEIYDSGLTVLTEVPEFGPDPSKYYAAVVAEADRPSVFMTEIDGTEALAVEPGTDKLGTNPGLVRFVSGDVSVVVSGAGMSVKELATVAGQLTSSEPM